MSAWRPAPQATSSARPPRGSRGRWRSSQSDAPRALAMDPGPVVIARNLRRIRPSPV